MTLISAVDVFARFASEVSGHGPVVIFGRGQKMAEGPVRSGANPSRTPTPRPRMAFVIGFALLLAWPMLVADLAAAQDTCRDTILYLPCDYWANQSLSKAGGLPHVRGDTTALPSSALAPMSGLSGIWDGAQLETIAVDSPGVGLPFSPGRKHGLAMDSRARVFVLFGRGSTDLYYFVYKDPGQPWSSQIALPSASIVHDRAGMAIGSGNDEPQFFYVEPGSGGTSVFVHATYHSASAQWEVDTAVQSAQINWQDWTQADIGADSQGGFHIVWPEPGWNDDLHAWVDQVKYAENTSGFWHLHTVGSLGTSPVLELDSSGRATIGYYARPEGHSYMIFASNRARGDTVWIADTIDTWPGIYSIADMRFGPDGTLHAIFQGKSCLYCFFINWLFYTKRPPGSRSFEPWYQVYNHAGPGRLMIDCAGHAHVWYPWYDEELISRAMYYATNASGTWMSRRFSFGNIDDWDVFGPGIMLDKFDQGRAVVSQMADHGWTMYYYGASTVYFDVTDVVRVINHVYLGKGVCDPYAYDEDCNGSVDVADLQWLINYAFLNGPKGCRF